MKSQLDSLKITRSYKALLDIHFLKINVAKATIFTILKNISNTLLLVYSSLPDNHILYIHKNKEGNLTKQPRAILIKVVES